jgi:probable F420-dependent oxidoreductase
VRLQVGASCGGDAWSRDLIRGVEEVGFDSFWTGEHIVYHRPILDAVPILAVAAAVTRRIRIGPATLLVTLRHPTLVAKEFASLDLLSGGRVILTVGVGGDYPREFQACGVPFHERGRRGDEAIEIIRRYWTGETFDYDGQVFTLRQVEVRPPPVQPGGPPIWVAGRSEAAMHRAARLGDGYFPYMFGPERCRRSFEHVAGLAAAAGRALPRDFVFALFQYVSLGDDRAEARARGLRDIAYRLGRSFEGLVDRYCISGPAGEVVERLRAFAEQGVWYFVLAPILDPGRPRENLEGYREVLAGLRQTTAPDLA